MMTEVFIFKTNANTQTHVQRVAASFESIVSIKQWSFDLEDCDRVLRVVGSNLQPEIIKRILESVNITCEQMEYEL